MDEDYIEESVLRALFNHNRSPNNQETLRIAKDITRSIKKDIIKFHEFQNRELTKALLIKQTRIGNLEQRNKKNK